METPNPVSLDGQPSPPYLSLYLSLFMAVFFEPQGPSQLDFSFLEYMEMIFKMWAGQETQFSKFVDEQPNNFF